MKGRIFAVFLAAASIPGAGYGAQPQGGCLAAAEAAEARARVEGAAAVTDWPGLIAHCISPLRVPRGSRWPLVLWQSGPPEAWTEAALRAAGARGIVPTIRLDPRWLALAARLQGQGLPVIVIEGRSSGSPWPYSLAGPWPPPWNLQFDDDSAAPEAWRSLPVPSRLDGWAASANELRKALNRFRLAGIRIDAFWMDYETHPSMLDYAAVREATNLEGMVPPEALSDAAGFATYRRQLWHQLVSTYVAAPIREAYPQAAVTNWLAVISTADNPTRSWSGEPHPVTGPMLFTHTNPVAYGIDRGLRESLGSGVVAFPAETDWAYLNILLRQASADTANRQRVAPYLGSLAWVARWLADLPDHPAPVMSRTLYREALRHLWLRGVDAMAVFNPSHPGHAAYQLAEVQDAAQVYAELLPYLQLLADAEAFGLEVPAIDRPQPFWSGMRDLSRAVVRVYNPTQFASTVTVTPWPGSRVLLEALPGGTSFLLHRQMGGTVRAEKLANSSVEASP